MNTRRFRPTLDSLPSRLALSGYSTAILDTTSSEEPNGTETSTQVSYPTNTCCERRGTEDFYA